jgi:chemosensory pili system protein ChpA (sensor histidine kinase/response regulator)
MSVIFYVIVGHRTKKTEIRMKLILLVEDSRFLRLANEKALVKAGYSVVTASDGEEALHIAFARIPDLILLDVLLPKLGGVEVLHALRNNPPTTLIPVIVLSSLPQKNENKLKEAGATAYFEKSQLGLDQHSESLINIIKRTLDDFTEHKGQAVPPCVALSSSRYVRERQT